MGFLNGVQRFIHNSGLCVLRDEAEDFSRPLEVFQGLRFCKGFVKPSVPAHIFASLCFLYLGENLSKQGSAINCSLFFLSSSFVFVWGSPELELKHPLTGSTPGITRAVIVKHTVLHLGPSFVTNSVLFCLISPTVAYILRSVFTSLISPCFVSLQGSYFIPLVSFLQPGCNFPEVTHC